MEIGKTAEVLIRRSEDGAIFQGKRGDIVSSEASSGVRMSVVFRSAEDGDLDAMAAIRAQEWETEAYWKRRIGGYMAGEQSPQQALASRAVFVAVDAGSVVGFVAGHRTRRYGCDAELEWINVAPQQRGRGIAGQLLIAMARWFVEQNALRVCVDVEPKNTVARGFYARYGAERLNDHWMVWEDIRTIATGRASIRG